MRRIRSRLADWPGRLERMLNVINDALRHADLGYPAFPCVPGEKRPLTEHGCLEATTKAEQIEEWWTRWPDANIGISSGELLILDVDGADNPWLTPERAQDLAQYPMQRTPRGGRHYFFRVLHPMGNTQSVIAPKVDTRGQGGYVLVDPSVVGGGRYQMINDLPPLADLPLAPQWLLALLGSSGPAPAPSGSLPASCRKDVMNWTWGLIENLPDAVSGQGGHNATLTAACECFRAGCTGEEAGIVLARWNTLKCHPIWSDKELNHKLTSALNKVVRDGEFDSRPVPRFDVQTFLANSGPRPVHPDDEPGEPDLACPVFPHECMENLPFMLRLACDWTLSTAPKPLPIITLGAHLALFSSIFGQVVQDNYRTRTNMMILGIAPTGSGKEHPRQQNKVLLNATGLDTMCGPEGFGSSAGIVSSIRQQSVRLFQIDEIGRLLATMRDAGRSPHLFKIADVLMKLYSSSNTMWTGDAYADLEHVATIDQPCLSLFGTSVPSNFYGSLTKQNLVDGLMGRMIVLHADRQPRREPTGVRTPPAVLVESIRLWRSWHAGMLASKGNLSDLHPDPFSLTKTPEAHVRHEQYSDAVDARHFNETEVQEALWSRAPEKVAKLAMIYSCCACPDPFQETPQITLEAEEWAIRLVNYSTRLILFHANSQIAETAFDYQQKQVFSKIKDGMTLSALHRVTQGLRARERAEVLDALEAAGSIKRTTEVTGGRAKTVIRKLRHSA